MVAPDLEFGL